MSRNIHRINDNLCIIYGEDHVLGNFLEVIDQRISGEDNQAQYLFEYSDLLGFTINRLEVNEVGNKLTLMKIKRFISDGMFFKEIVDQANNYYSQVSQQP